MSFEGFSCTASTNPLPLSKKIESREEWDSNSITYLLAVHNNLSLVRRNMAVVYPFVDRVLVVDGHSTGGTEDYLKAFPKEKVKLFQMESPDIVELYNVGLSYSKGGWILAGRANYIPSDGLLQNLRFLVRASNNATTFGTVEFSTAEIRLDGQSFDEKKLDEYLPMLYRFNKNLHYCTEDGKVLFKDYQNPIAHCDHLYYKVNEDV